MFKKIMRWYCLGLWTKVQITQAVEKGMVSLAQAEEILEGNYA